MWYVYVLKCKDNSLYVGFTGDIEKRLHQHGIGRVRWTKNRWPVKLVYREAFSREKEAIEREKELKTGFGRKWLKRRIAAQAGLPAAMQLEINICKLRKHSKKEDPSQLKLGFKEEEKDVPLSL